MAVGGIECRHELEGVERLAARVDLLKNDADGLLGRARAESDDGHGVALEVLQHLLLETPELHPNLFVLVAAPERVEAILPIVPIENVGQGIHLPLVLIVRGPQIQDHVAAEMLGDQLVLADGYDRVLAIDGRIERLGDIDIEPPLHRPLLRGDRLHDLPAQGDLIQRSHALLPIQEERLRLDVLRRGRSAFDRARLEIHVSAGFERHQGSDGECSRHRGDQAFDAVLVPHPASLEIGELEVAPVAIPQKFMKVVWVGLEGRTAHPNKSPAADRPGATTIRGCK
jgi:hypothetical protein